MTIRSCRENVDIKNSGFLVPESCNLAENVVDLRFSKLKRH